MYEAVLVALKTEYKKVGERFTWQADGLIMTLWPSGTLSLWMYAVQGNADCMSWPKGSPLANTVVGITS